MEDLVSFVKYRIAAMDSDNRDTLLQLSSATILGLVDDISAVIVERKKYNEAYIDADPGVLPHKLVRILPCDLSVYLQRRRERLDYTFSIKEIGNIRRQHKALINSYLCQPELMSSIGSFDNSDAYWDACNGLHNRYSALDRFAGGLVTIFPGTSTVESNFLVVTPASKESFTRNSTGICVA